MVLCKHFGGDGNDMLAIVRITYFSEYEKIPCKVGGKIPRGSLDFQLNLEKYFSKGELRNLFEGTCFAVVAADEALNMANWKPSSQRDKERTGK